MRFRVFLLILIAAGAGLAQTNPPAKPVLDADRAFNRATQQNRLDGWMSYMADNVVLFGMNPPAVGKDAVRKIYESNFANPNFSLSWEPQHGEMQPSGRMGYTTGRWIMRGKNAKGESIERHGSYLTVWQKQKDESWKVIADGGTPDK